ncbi:hypothetical protein BpHYR1_043851 [Brachionus plicatilis]|uniref:Uncharacterized protein n=1 Tax=Brachionus plicatilis TaxID=10195 RepID=A0A3M7TB52_BRAPC|nr:hypothetical protein BpHYR1_043851 [Brachionus plicatilis]
MSSKKQVFDNSTPIKAGRSHRTKFQKLNNSDEVTEVEIAEKNAQVPVLGCETGHPMLPNSSAEHSIDGSLEDSAMTNEASYPPYQEINVNTNGAYDYQNGAVPVQIGSPYYVYQSPYTQPEYQIMNTPQQNCSLYQAYVYDPNLGAYTLNTYSPMQQQQQQQQQLSSPQQQTSLLGSYQTPRQPQNLYNMVNSCMSPMDSTVPTSNESAANSPCQYQYVMYPTQNTYLSPMAAPQTYMMYQPAPAQQQTPTSVPTEKTKGRKSSKKSAKNQMTSVESTPAFPTCDQNQSIYQSNSASPISSQDQHIDEHSSQGMYMTQPIETMYPSPVSMCSPASSENPYAFCDQNGMFNMQNYYDYVNGGIQSFGDDEEEEEEDLDQENEQLACYTCRGRRMCFCYFLKVRYYKFPSFLDLVDHQYKKWRQNMMKAKKSN